jgi:hypothetical protein
MINNVNVTPEPIMRYNIPLTFENIIIVLLFELILLLIIFYLGYSLGKKKNVVKTK